MIRQCNVIIRDREFQEIHHALGCPWPEAIMGETYRNYFAARPDSDEAKRMTASPYWSGGDERFNMCTFFVTNEGRKALRKYMAANVQTPKRFAVVYKHYRGMKVVVAKSRSAAKYAAYLDDDIDMSFQEYLSEIRSVRLFAPEATP